MRPIKIKLRIDAHDFFHPDARQALENLDPFQCEIARVQWIERRNTLAGIVSRAGSSLN